ncbi:hypothetical protein Hanom_Chr03g00184881 [Helianthus anomalus]
MRSVFSVWSEMNRRHSIAASSVRDDESMDSSPSVPSFLFYRTIVCIVIARMAL